jgi:hypothetical protein
MVQKSRRASKSLNQSPKGTHYTIIRIECRDQPERACGTVRAFQAVHRLPRGFAAAEGSACDESGYGRPLELGGGAGFVL